MKELSELVIVYAEDDQLLRETVCEFLRRRVGCVYEAENGEEGLALVKEHDPDVVITDIEMPKMNGLEMIEEVRSQFNFDHPIIVITAYDDSEHYTEKANAYLYKPLNLKELLEQIKTLIAS